MTGALSASAGAAVGVGVGVGVGATMALTEASHDEPRHGRPPLAFVPFEGRHQAGITALPIPEQGLVASFNLQTRDRASLKATLQDVTDEIRGLMAGKPPGTRDPAFPPVDSGILGKGADLEHVGAERDIAQIGEKFHRRNEERTTGIHIVFQCFLLS